MRRRYIQLNGELVEVALDHAAPARNRDSVLWNDREYQDMGDPRFNSRKTHREFMKRNNLTTADDFKEAWSKAEGARRDIRVGRDTMRRVDIDRAMARRK